MLAIRCWNALGIVLLNLHFIRSNLSKEQDLKPAIQQEHILLATSGSLQEKFIYVDKTKFVLQLIKDKNKRYFFSRPRQMGKTVFLRTLQAIFEGRKEIFEGTDIYGSNDYAWKKHPVMYFDLSSGSLESVFDNELESFKKKQGINNIAKECVFIPENITQPIPIELQLFKEVLCTKILDGEPYTVILIDEYDQHLLENSEDSVKFEAVSNFLRRFFLFVKGHAHGIELACVTGITRCSFVTIESQAGDFTDITFDPKYGEIAGTTEEELIEYFQPHIKDVAGRRSVDESIIKQELKYWYNGYSFTGTESMYNTMAILRYFKSGVPSIYWGEKARAAFFWREMKRRPEDFSDLKTNVRRDLRSATGNVRNTEAHILMFEAGYLTIGRVDTYPMKSYLLRFANNETEKAFFKDLVAAKMLAKGKTNIKPQILKMKKAIEEPIPDFNAFLQAANAVIQRLPFRYNDEESFHSTFYSFVDQCGLEEIRAKDNTLHAEIDITGETLSTTFLFELKLAREGISRCWTQVESRVPQFFSGGKNILAAAILFNPKSTKSLLISGWKAVLYNETGSILKNYSNDDCKWFKEWSGTTVSKMRDKTTSTTDKPINPKTILSQIPNTKAAPTAKTVL